MAGNLWTTSLETRLISLKRWYFSAAGPFLWNRCYTIKTVWKAFSSILSDQAISLELAGIRLTGYHSSKLFEMFELLKFEMQVAWKLFFYSEENPLRIGIPSYLNFWSHFPPQRPQGHVNEWCVFTVVWGVKNFPDGVKQGCFTWT